MLFRSLIKLTQKLIKKHRDAFGSPPSFTNVENTAQILNDLEMTSFTVALDKVLIKCSKFRFPSLTQIALKVTTPEEKLEAKRQAALKAAERKAAKKRENEMAQEQLGNLTLVAPSPSTTRAAKANAAKKIKSSLAADEEEEEGEEYEMSDGDDDNDNDPKAEAYILKKQLDVQGGEITALEHDIQGLQQQLDFVSAQNVAYQQRLQVLTEENEKLKEKVVELQQENDALIQLNELTMDSATEEMKRKIEQLEAENSLTHQVDDMAIDSSASNGEESASESTTDE